MTLPSIIEYKAPLSFFLPCNRYQNHFMFGLIICNSIMIKNETLLRPCLQNVCSTITGITWHQHETIRACYFWPRLHDTGMILCRYDKAKAEMKSCHNFLFINIKVHLDPHCIVWIIVSFKNIPVSQEKCWILLIGSRENIFKPIWS